MYGAAVWTANQPRDVANLGGGGDSLSDPAGAQFHKLGKADGESFGDSADDGVERRQKVARLAAPRQRQLVRERAILFGAEL